MQHSSDEPLGGNDNEDLCGVYNYIAGIPVETKHDEKWNHRFRCLQDYRRLKGDCDVPQNYKDDKQLGRWVHYQRTEYWLRKKKGAAKITEERIDCLEQIGFEWDPNGTQWNDMFNRLLKFREFFGHMMVPKNYSPDASLAHWVRNQRFEMDNLRANRKSRLTEERCRRLNMIGFVWKPGDIGEMQLDGIPVTTQS
jgi:hypothetical protein